MFALVYCNTVGFSFLAYRAVAILLPRTHGSSRAVASIWPQQMNNWNLTIGFQTHIYLG